jgi:hypothetical protein
MFHCRPSDRPRSRAYLLTVHIVFGLLFAASLALVFGGVVMLLWNRLLPDLFGFAPLTYWQGVGLLLLARILTGGLGHGKSGHSHARPRPERQPWQEYDTWWKEVGEKSFRRHTQGPGNESGEKDL